MQNLLLYMTKQSVIKNVKKQIFYEFFTKPLRFGQKRAGISSRHTQNKPGNSQAKINFLLAALKGLKGSPHGI